NLSSCRALGRGAFGEVYAGLVIGLPGDPSPLQVTIKTLPELCSQQDQLDFLMETLSSGTPGARGRPIRTLRCVGLSMQAAPGPILLELMSGGDMKSFLRHRWPQLTRPFS
ncbi:hypothetical protein DBR06_SOUSAS20610051, partial [Sousa chinensis]